MADTHPHLHQSLRKDVRLLGRLLGEVIGHDRGPDLVADIESIRKLAKAARVGQQGEWEALSTFLGSIPAGKITDIANAFSQFLNLANIAEQHHQIRLQRDQDSLWPELLKMVDKKVLTGEQIRQSILETRVEIVLTAHPTEILKRTHVFKYNAIAAELKHLDQQEEHRRSHNLMRRLISEAWHTAEVRNDRPTPQEEAKWGFAIIENSLWEAIPQLYRELNSTLEEQNLAVVPIDARLVNFASWMGGDRVDNPNVTAEVSQEVLMLARWMAADLFIRDLERLQSDLSMRECSPELRRRVGRAQEPYRVLIKEIHVRMERTRDWAARLDPTPPGDPNDIFLLNEDLRELLELCYRSLVDCGMELIANGPLLDTLRRVACFGLELLNLDIRQEAKNHSTVLDEVTRYLEILINDRSYARWTESQKQNFLIEELETKRPLFPREWPISPESREVLDTLAVIAAQDARGVSGYIVSHASAPSDILAVLLLLQQLELKTYLPIVPAFESINDLQNAATMLDQLLQIPWYTNYLNAGDNDQQLMFGYSDLSKDAGQLSAAWIQYQAQEELLEIAKKHKVSLSFFHGRGGAIGRGGTHAYDTIMSLPPGSVSGIFRLTEQGEMIRFKLGLPDLAVATLAQYLGASVSAQCIPPEPARESWRETIEGMTQQAQKAYGQLVNNNDYFMEFFKDITPAQELSVLPLGSQPPIQSLSSNVHRLPVMLWIFAWTQIRLMLPAWLGTESALRKIIEEEKQSSERDLMQWPFYRTQIEMLENILSKADATLLRYYAQRLTMSSQHEVAEKLAERLEQLVSDLNSLNKRTSLLEFQPETQESLRVRDTYLDPLHLLQAELLDRIRLDEGRNESVRKALQLTMAGISSGLKNS